MKDEQFRLPGKYTDIDKKVLDEVEYTRTEIINVGKDFEILKYEATYNPPLKYPIEWNDLKEVKTTDIDKDFEIK